MAGMAKDVLESMNKCVTVQLAALPYGMASMA